MIHLNIVACTSARAAFLQGQHDCGAYYSHMLSTSTSIFLGKHDAWKHILYCCLVQSSSNSQKKDWKGDWQRTFSDREQPGRHHSVTFSTFRCHLQHSMSLAQLSYQKGKKRNWKRDTSYDTNPSNLTFRDETASRGMEGHGHPLFKMVLKAESVHAKFSTFIRNDAQTQFFHSQTLSRGVCILISHSPQYFCSRHMDSTRSFSMTHYLRAKCHEHLRVFYTWNSIFGSTKWLSFASDVSNTEQNKWQF